MYPVSQAYKDAIMQPSRQFRGRLLIPKLTMNFTRNSIAYKQDGMQVPPNTPRFEQGRFGKAVLVEDGTTNLNSDPFFKTGVSGWKKEIWTTLEWLSSEYNPFSKQNGVMRLYDNDGGNKYCSKVVSISNTPHTVSVLLKILKGNINRINVGGTIFYTDSTYTDYTWNNSNTTRYDMSAIFGQGVYKLVATITPNSSKTISKYEIRISHNSGVATELFVYAVQLEAKSYPTTFTDGTRAAETLTIPTAGVLNPQEGTVEFYHFFRSESEPVPWLVGSSLPNYTQFLAVVKSNANTIRFRTRNLSGTSTVEASVTDGWHYVAARWSSAEITLFIDGQKVGAVPNPYLPTQLASIIAIGYNHVSNTQYCNSLIDDLRISNRAKSDEEILAAYREVA